MFKKMKFKKIHNIQFPFQWLRALIYCLINGKVLTRLLEGLVLNLLGQDSPQLRARTPARDTMNTFTLNDIYTY